MRRSLFALLAVAAMFGFSGCQHMARHCGIHAKGCCDTCGADEGSCGCGHHGHHGHHGLGHHHGGMGGPNAAPPYGPPAAQVTYPYYTTRGPRDFLLNNPPSIGY